MNVILGTMKQKILVHPYPKGRFRLTRIAKFSVMLVLASLFGSVATANNTGNHETAIAPQQQSGTPRVIKGEVVDDQGEPLAGVNVVFKRTNVAKMDVATITDINGKYSITIPATDGTLNFSFIGTLGYTVDVKKQTVINATLMPDVSQVGEVVVTGMMTRKAESYTGSVNTVKGEDLKVVGNSNALQSLTTLDPSFNIVENSLMGSDPNTLPTVELRGKTSISTEDLRDEYGSDPNQPLFVLDGFETTLRTIVDLDMNRVASITLLKDAASTALYGARAANGVVVVETKEPESGKIRLSYTGDFKFEVPDLSDYNMMDSDEKLQFEKLAGRYNQDYQGADIVEDSVYNARLAAVRSGVNTYWLNVPLQMGFSNGHNVYIDGGEDAFRYGVSLNFKDTKGVMSGSGRQNWGGNIRLIYRKNKLNVNNNLTISGYESDDSPYGSFSTYVNTNPYYTKNNTSDRYLDEYHRVNQSWKRVDNPLYNASLQFLANTASFSVTNNTQLIYKFTPELRFQGNLQLSKTDTKQKDFTSPQHTQYDNTDTDEKGQYSQRQSGSFRYNLNAMLTYAKLFGEKHSLTANLRGEVSHNESDASYWQVVGFPIGSNINPSFATQYKPGTNLTYSTNIYRRAGFLASANYAYDRRYLLDATYRVDGSTSFGSSEKYSPFWSVGAGWNIHNEAFMSGIEWLTLLKLRASIGVTGNQGFGSVTSVDVYQFLSNNSIFGQGIYLSSLGNPYLEWQKTMNPNIGFDFSALNRVDLRFDVYQRYSDPLIVSVTSAPSTGKTAYQSNAGAMDTRGIDTRLTVTPIYKPQERIIWKVNLSASVIRSTYENFGKLLDNLNDDNEASSNIDQSLIRYKDGYSPDDIWAVRSLGIDPATGKEIFLTEEGKTTFNYNASDAVQVGNTRPDIEGIIGTSLNYKIFNFAVNMRYRLGGDVFNKALYEKVENISLNELDYNQDKRALYDRWQNPGDIAQFKSISTTTTTPISSRFVQKQNQLIGESISIGVRLRDTQFVKKMGLRELRINGYMNEFFRLETSKVERGTDYPFARSFSLSINAAF
ncbi:MAG: SusC/RagA family TonB-linked outer membrane protein [Bacteroidales bacterium]